MNEPRLGCLPRRTPDGKDPVDIMVGRTSADLVVGVQDAERDVDGVEEFLVSSVGVVQDLAVGPVRASCMEINI
ncbi:hypothetical protein [Micromonospora sicca]|uniref:hypothetical protein n=1 Tax=Micromonospora sicca TaxID=2202420 RepID=UPI0011B6E1DC|nr:hypothetical protein [Micromonospora sp. 4G51]